MLGPCWQKVFALSSLAPDHSAIRPATFSWLPLNPMECGISYPGLLSFFEPRWCVDCDQHGAQPTQAWWIFDA